MVKYSHGSASPIEIKGVGFLEWKIDGKNNNNKNKNMKSKVRKKHLGFGKIQSQSPSAKISVPALEVPILYDNQMHAKRNETKAARRNTCCLPTRKEGKKQQQKYKNEN